MPLLFSCDPTLCVLWRQADRPQKETIPDRACADRGSSSWLAAISHELFSAHSPETGTGILGGFLGLLEPSGEAGVRDTDVRLGGTSEDKLLGDK